MSYLIISSNQKFIDNFISKETKVKNFSTNNPDFLIIENEKNKKSLGISQVKKGIEWGSKMPYTSDLKILTIKNFNTATIPAQNSLLKFIEEPPEYLKIFLIASSLEGIIGTILSRCKTIKDTSLVDNKDFTLETLLNNSLEANFKLVNAIKKLEKSEITNLINGWINKIKNNEQFEIEKKHILIEELLILDKRNKEPSSNFKLFLETFLLILEKQKTA
jgi:DNA polymerase III delta prime subunit